MVLQIVSLRHMQIECKVGGDMGTSMLVTPAWP